MPWKVRMFWNVRLIPPLAAARCAGHPVMSSPRRRMAPASAFRSRLVMLSSVVFPAPLGPMSPITFPWASAKLTSFSALSPPKCFVTPSMTSTGDAACAGLGNLLGPRRAQQAGLQADERTDQPVRQEDDDYDEQHAGQGLAILLELDQPVRHAGHEQRPEHRTQRVGISAEQGKHEKESELAEAELEWHDHAVDVGPQAAGKRGERGADEKSEQAIALDVDPHAARSRLVGPARVD